MTRVFYLTLILVASTWDEASSEIGHSFSHVTRFSGLSPRLKELRVLNSWKQVDFTFPTIESKNDLIEEGHYIPGNPIIIDADYWSKGTSEKIFVTLPRLKPGIPVTLARVSYLRNTDGSSLLQPYPDWSWHGDKDCESLISVFRTKIDACDRLWVIDSGVIDALNTQRRLCQPKILAFDLHTDKLILKHILPETVLLTDSMLVTIAIDVRDGQCADTFAYMADVTEYGLVVFNSQTRETWRVNSNFFYPFPTHGSFSVGGEQFELMDGLLGLALSPLQTNGDKTLYFHSLASVREGKVSVNLLRNSTNFKNGHNSVSDRFLISPEVRPSQAAAEDMSSDGILFFGLLSSSSISCWNSKMPYIPTSLVTVAQNNETLQFPSGIKTVWKNGHEELFVITSKFQSYLLETLDDSKSNFHILSASVPDLVRGTLCDQNFILHHDDYPDVRVHRPRFYFPWL